jgi:hypothetical protein
VDGPGACRWRAPFPQQMVTETGAIGADYHSSIDNPGFHEPDLRAKNSTAVVVRRFERFAMTTRCAL